MPQLESVGCIPSIPQEPSVCLAFVSETLEIIFAEIVCLLQSVSKAWFLWGSSHKVKSWQIFFCESIRLYLSDVFFKLCWNVTCCLPTWQQNKYLPDLPAEPVLYWRTRACSTGMHWCFDCSCLVTVSSEDSPSYCHSDIKQVLKHSSSSWIYSFWVAALNILCDSGTAFSKSSLFWGIRVVLLSKGTPPAVMPVRHGSVNKVEYVALTETCISFVSLSMLNQVSVLEEGLRETKSSE